MTITVPKTPTIPLADVRSKDGVLLEKPVRITEPTSGKDVGFKLNIFAIHDKTSEWNIKGKKVLFIFRNDTGKAYVYETWEAWQTDEQKAAAAERKRIDEEKRKRGEAIDNFDRCCMGSLPTGPGHTVPYEVHHILLFEGNFEAKTDGVVIRYDLFGDKYDLSNDVVLKKYPYIAVEYDLADETIDIEVKE
jgi:hypothetical protein